MKAKTTVAVANVKGRSFLHFVDDRPKRLRYDIDCVQVALVERSKLQQLGAELVRSTGGANQIAIVLERASESQDRAFIHLGALRQLGERQLRILIGEGIKNRQRP